MAKQQPPKGGTSRIRFIMLDAEIPEGDLNQITAAIQNALKPTTTVIQQRVVPQLAGAQPDPIIDAADDPTHEQFDGGELPEAAEAISSRKPAREAVARKPTVPKVVDVDLSSGTSLEAFANKCAPKNDIERNLVVLAWFKEHRGEEAITANHVYTCYRALKWPSGIDDFSWPLRALKKDQLATSPARGQYSINHLGIARVEAMSSAA